MKNLIYSIILSMIRDKPLQNPVVKGAEDIRVPPLLTAQDKNIKVMTFNIKCFAKADKVAHTWSNRKQNVQNLIDRQEADIIGLQEVKHPQYKFFIENMADQYGYFGTYRTGLNLASAEKILRKKDPKPNSFYLTFASLIDEASPIFYKKSRYELLDCDMFWLSDTPAKPSADWGATHYRVATYVKLKDHYTNKVLHVFNTHFDNASDVARQNSSKLINRIIEQKGLDNVIVMGDMNDVEGSSAYQKLISETLSNSKFLMPEAERSNGPTYNGYGKMIDLPIDHIFLQQENFNVISNRIIADRINKDTFISDHFPVVAILKQK